MTAGKRNGRHAMTLHVRGDAAEFDDLRSLVESVAAWGTAYDVALSTLGDALKRACDAWDADEDTVLIANDLDGDPLLYVTSSPLGSPGRAVREPRFGVTPRCDT